MNEESRKDRTAADAAGETAPAGGEAAEDGAPAAAASEALPPEDLAQLKRRAEERDKLFERLQRAVADLDNFQKRVKRDRQITEEAKVRQFVKEFLPVVDDIERLDAALEGALSIADVRTALRLLRDKARNVLAGWKIEEIEAVGAQFDPGLHEAVRFHETDAAAAGAVVEDTRRGYTMRGDVLRASQVVVARRPPKAPGAGDAAAEGPADRAGED